MESLPLTDDSQNIKCVVATNEFEEDNFDEDKTGRWLCSIHFRKIKEKVESEKYVETVFDVKLIFLI